MATASQVIRAALLKILVQDNEAEFQPSEYQDGIFALNNMLLAWDAQGIILGFTEITNLSDIVTVPNGALRGIIANLAVEMAADYNSTVTPSLANQADQGLVAIRKLGQTRGVSYYPSTLPIGSGNEGYGWGYNSRFYYPAQPSRVLAETTGPIALEDGTEDQIEGA